MIQKEQVFPIGQIIKPHGIHGEMTFDITSDVLNRDDIPFFIFEIDGILVPFSVETYRYKSNTTGILQLEGVVTEQEAKQFSGLTIYIQKQYLDEVEDAEIELDYFVGFRLIDVEKGEIGVIYEVDQTTENALFVIQKDDDELLIPVGDEYIQEIDHQQKTITVTLPEGLLDL